MTFIKGIEKKFYSRLVNSVTKFKLIVTALFLNGVLSTFINLYKNQQILKNLKVKMHNRTDNKVLTYSMILANYCCFKMKKEKWRVCLHNFDVGWKHVYVLHNNICICDDRISFELCNFTPFYYTTSSLNDQATSNGTLLSILHNSILNG